MSGKRNPSPHLNGFPLAHYSCFFPSLLGSISPPSLPLSGYSTPSPARVKFSKNISCSDITSDKKSAGSAWSVVCVNSRVNVEQVVSLGHGGPGGEEVNVGGLNQTKLLFSIVMYCAVWFGAVLHQVLCHTILCHTVLCCAILCSNVLCCVMRRCAL
ncbi:hypothetical protein DNTS_033911 [Danionella cerebrum]|uniref:Uncharacterized protein n=1 Tax=Danionella cerebrum TaxID=2873325 RepID=A0A553N0H7_9TELE|nr:hypothetical protein DNTS_033911 [Danionella translucida]